jgi:hypothetical protein
LIDARTEQIRALAQKGNEVETFAAFDLLANQAESVLRALRLTKLVLDPDLDGAEMDVVSYPLKTLRKLLWDGIEWRDAHRAIYIFQYAYMRHREDVIMCRAHCPRTIAFDSEVTKTEVAEGDGHDFKWVCDHMASHILAMRDQADKLRGEFGASAIIPPVVP